MPKRPPFAELERLVAAGRLRLVYVLGVPRSNTTVVCRLLGERLDGAVYEPAMPNSVNPRRHYARTILAAYHAARAGAGERPVVLAVKDLDGFVTEELFEFVLGATVHLIFTIRDPLLQHASLSRQFVTEFSPLHRIRSTMRYPVEQTLFLWQLLEWLPRYWRLARAELGGSLNPLRAAVAGFNYSSWRAQAAHLERARARFAPERIAIFDAGLMRLYPHETNAELEAIAAAHAGAEPGLPSAEIPGHTRMRAESHWAEEARAGGHIKPLTPDALATLGDPAADAFARRVADTLYPQYVASFFDPLHRQRTAVRGKPAGAEIPEALRELMEADDANEAARRLREVQPAA